MQHKACPVIFRTSDGATELLAFRHPTAGKQFVKGSVEDGETPAEAAARELEEESGLSTQTAMVALGEAEIGPNTWHFFVAKFEGAPEHWHHQTKDDCGHIFHFFWQPIADDLSDEWHSDFHQALEVIRQALAGR